ncbi:hypothetical protein FH972_015058 [Carpinus fangiana]|uniref:Secreted protein n=1 Tax=Carpinus fangiana TaxID=176857 RepID=A0A5N6RBM0_9ROSI|nr:hypothetical protein FH972_015058 [Carpinus fangiana]
MTSSVAMWLFLFIYSCRCSSREQVKASPEQPLSPQPLYFSSAHVSTALFLVSCTSRATYTQETCTLGCNSVYPGESYTRASHT